jgi:NADH:ubiquinone oxidoreductase subunit C
LLPDETVIKHILADAGQSDADIQETALGLVCTLAPSVVASALAAFKESELDFATLVDLMGTDTGEEIELSYHLRSFTRDEEIHIKCRVAYDSEISSVWNTYPSALMPERETAELFGLTLSGHPNPKRLLTTDGVEPLLRKSSVIRTLQEVRDR